MERCMGIRGDKSRMRNLSTCLACGGVVVVRGILLSHVSQSIRNGAGTPQFASEQDGRDGVSHSIVS